MTGDCGFGASCVPGAVKVVGPPISGGEMGTSGVFEGIDGLVGGASGVFSNDLVGGPDVGNGTAVIGGFGVANW